MNLNNTKRFIALITISILFFQCSNNVSEPSYSSSPSKVNTTVAQPKTTVAQPKTTVEIGDQIVRPFRTFQSDQDDIVKALGEKNLASLKILCKAWGNGVLTDDKLVKEAGDMWRVLNATSSGSKYSLDCDIKFFQFRNGGLNINNTRFVKGYLYGENTKGEFGERVITYTPTCEEISNNLDEMIENLLYLEVAHDQLYEEYNYLGVDEVKYSWRAVVRQWLEISEANSGTMMNSNYVDYECLTNNYYKNDSKYDTYFGIYLSYGELIWSRDEQYKNAYNW
ncbi:hypothetical protein N9A50_04320 [Acidimicrobiaceae bacterium]|nr:hypothetical protein [Acidimicrobiaceae bacterium]